MSTILEKAEELKKNTGYSTEVWQKLTADHPCLAKALRGEKGPKGEWKLHPATICVYLDGDMIKFSLNMRDDRLTAFGRLPDRVLSFDDIEAEIAAGRFELRGKR